MITNLFSIFDPSTLILNIPFNWSSLFIPFCLLPGYYWLNPNKLTILFYTLTNTLKSEFVTLLGRVHYKGSTLILLSIFFLILIINISGLTPYVFTPTRHIILTVSLALPIWLAIIIYSWFIHTLHILAHIVPQGTPPILIMFIVCIETISNIIRPLTLSVRLAANIIAGHLLITLLGNQGPNIPLISLPFFILIQILLLILESAVAIIQAYVFVVLSTLYISEAS